jgi:hypothetical protein
MYAVWAIASIGLARMRRRGYRYIQDIRAAPVRDLLSIAV